MRTADGNIVMRVLLIVTFCLLLLSGAMGSVAYMGGDLYPAPSFWEADAALHSVAHEQGR